MRIKAVSLSVIALALLVLFCACSNKPASNAGALASPYETRDPDEPEETPAQKTMAPDGTNNPATSQPTTASANDFLDFSVLGRSAQKDGITFTVHGMAVFGKTDEYTAVEMSVKNNTKKEITISQKLSLLAKDAQGTSISTDVNSLLYLGMLASQAGKKVSIFDATIPPGKTSRGLVTYLSEDAVRIETLQLTVLEEDLSQNILAVSVKK